MHILTEKDCWESTDDLAVLFDSVPSEVSDRKWFLFACACCEQVGTDIPGVALIARICAEGAGTSTLQDRWSMIGVLSSAMQGEFNPLIGRFLSQGRNDPRTLARSVSSLMRVWEETKRRANGAQLELERSPDQNASTASLAQAAILREIIPNPNHEGFFDDNWRTEHVMGLALAIEEEQVWDRMPILADALQDAGCEDWLLLNHCRSETVRHLRGCWALDRILGRD